MLMVTVCYELPKKCVICGVITSYTSDLTNWEHSHQLDELNRLGSRPVVLSHVQEPLRAGNAAFVKE